MIRIVSILAIAFLVGCATTHTTTTLTQLDDGKDVIIRVGDTLTLEIPSNRTTGYSWKECTPAAPVLKIIGEPAYLPDRHPAGMVGVGGVEVWRFRAIRAGQQTLRLEYARPWEKDTPPANTLVYKVVVKE